MALKIFFTCFFSAFAGGWISISLDPNHSVWTGLLGAVTAFVLGYISWESKAIIEAIAKGIRATYFAFTVKRLLPTLIKLLKALGFRTVLYTLSISWFLVMCFVSFSLSTLIISEDLLDVKINIEGIIGISIIMGGVFFFPLVEVFASMEKNGKKRGVLLKTLVLKGNPVALLIYWPIVLMRKLCSSIINSVLYIWIQRVPIIESIGKSLYAIVVFLYKVYREIHTEIRLTIAVDSFLGCVAGYFILDNIILGGVTAGFLGIVNYYLIALKILKLKPIEIRK